ncbi:hypothetical protein ACGFZ9_06100 [Streptomyces mirabilis]|uniref:hypothetical protein n=1 Tax=Streptomyces mirabilis TaxID=68239 RepID=UPI003722D960
MRLTVSRRGCPACGDSYCFNPAECLGFLTDRPWADCVECDGSGWAGDDSFAIFCENCAGSGLSEHTADTAQDEISDNAKTRLAVYVGALRTRVASAPARLAVTA